MRVEHTSTTYSAHSVLFSQSGAQQNQAEAPIAIFYQPSHRELSGSTVELRTVLTIGEALRAQLHDAPKQLTVFRKVLHGADRAYIPVERCPGGGKTTLEECIDVATCSESHSWINGSASIGRLR